MTILVMDKSRRLAPFFRMATSSAAIATALLMSAPVLAQADGKLLSADSGEDRAVSDADIVVTGSRAARDGFKAPTPVTVVGLEQIEAQAPKDMSDFVNQIPSIAGSMTPVTRSIQISNGTAGIATPALRGLGSHRTLILLDGQRSVASTGTGEVDIETFPQQLISRIDVVTGGASAVYGSDALSGVVNFVLDRNFTGIKGEVSSGFTTYGDDFNWKAGLSAGLKFGGGRGHILLSGELMDSEGAFGNDYANPPKRKWLYGTPGILLNPAYTPTNGQPFYTIGDNYVISVATIGGIITSGPLRGTAFDRQGNPYQFNYGVANANGYQSGGSWQNSDLAGFMILSPRMSRQNAFGRVSFDVSDRFRIFGQASYARSTSRGGYISTGVIGNQVLRTDYAYLPQSVRNQLIAAGQPAFTLGYWKAGDRFGNKTEREVQRYVAGAEGDFDLLGGNWDWNVYYQHGRTRSDERIVMNARRAEYNLAVDAVVDPATGRIVCRSTLTNPNNGCRPYDVIGFDEPDAATTAYIFGEAQRVQKLTQDVVAAEIRGEPFSTWAGPVALALGGEYRRESISGEVDALSRIGGFSGGNFLPLDGKYNVKEAFAEVSIPLAKDAPFARALDINGAVRATDYSTSGYVTTWKAGLTWAPIDDIRFRFTRSRDIRAPSMSELFTQGQTVFTSINDPVVNGPAYLSNVKTTGNLGLRPEKADTLGFGVILQPRFLPGFTASADYYDIKVKGAIGSLSAQSIINQCYIAQISQFCSAITRQVINGVDTITQIAAQPFNFVSQRAKGIDFEASYRTGLDGLFKGADGNLTFRLLATHFIDNVFNDGITPPVDIVGSMFWRQDTPSVGAIPHWKYSASVTLDQSPFAATLTARGVGKNEINSIYVECQSSCPASTTAHPTISDNRVPGAVYFDASVTLKPDLPARPEVFFSVQNIANKHGAYVPRGPGGTALADRATQAGVYDLLGRTFRFGLRFKY